MPILFEPLTGEMVSLPIASSTNAGLLSPEGAAKLNSAVLGYIGYYATPEALTTAHPTGEDGQFASVGTTDTFWIWDSDTSAWKDSGTASVVTWASLTGKPATFVLMKNGTVDDTGKITLSDETAVSDLPITGFVVFTAANIVQGVAIGDIYQKKLQSVIIGEATVTDNLAQFLAVGKEATATKAGLMSASDKDKVDHLFPFEVSTELWVDSGFEGTVLDGTINRPFKTLAEAVATIASSCAIHLAPGTYSHTGDLTLPNYPLIIYGNKSTLTISGTLTVQNPNYVRYDLHTTGTIVFSSSAAGRVMIHGGTLNGNVTVSGLTDFKSVNLTANNITVTPTGQLLVIASTISSKITSNGILYFIDCDMATNSTTPLISSLNGVIYLLNSKIKNTGTGACVSCNNSAAQANPNVISGCFISAASGAPVANGTAYTLYSRNHISGTNTGSNYLPVNSDIIGGTVKMALGSDATGDLYCRDANGNLARLPSGVGFLYSSGAGVIPTWDSPIPVGTVVDYAGDSSNIPSGFLLCNHATISRTTYANLFTKIGGRYGVGDGSTTFSIPDYPLELVQKIEDLQQASAEWVGLAVLGNDVYSAQNGGDIYKQTGSAGNFVAIGQASRAWHGICATTSGNLYACVRNDGIYKQTGGAGDFVKVYDNAIYWYDICALGNDVYATVYNGDIYKRTGETGDFVALSQAGRPWSTIWAFNGDVYACTLTGDIYKQTGGAGDFVAISAPVTGWQGIGEFDGSLYVATTAGIIYRMQQNGTLVPVTAVGVNISALRATKNGIYISPWAGPFLCWRNTMKLIKY